jgi:hypothetical protein
MSKEPEPVGVFMNRPHLVLLGAGASVAALPRGDLNGRMLPLMCNIVDVVGLGPLLDEAGFFADRGNFEKLFSDLVMSGSSPQLVAAIEQRIFDFFSDLRLPDEPTLYDHLVLSLREKDVIATFNWDPFLWQAINRCHERLEGSVEMPSVLYLHGNTAIGYAEHGGTIVIGTRGAICRRNGEKFERGPLMFPVAQKDYQKDERISKTWDDVKRVLGSAYMFTIFGYSAPVTDVEAVEMLRQGWGKSFERNLEEIEIIDIRNEEDLRNTWKPFIHSHHYRTTNDFYSSTIANSPRRSCDAMWDQLMERNPIRPLPLPWSAGWDELVDAVRSLTAYEMPREEVA